MAAPLNQGQPLAKRPHERATVLGRTPGAALEHRDGPLQYPRRVVERLALLVDGHESTVRPIAGEAFASVALVELDGFVDTTRLLGRQSVQVATGLRFEQPPILGCLQWMV